MDYDYPIDLKNDSNHKLRCNSNTNLNYEYIYPDTSLYREPQGVIVYPGQTVDVGGGSLSWESIYENIDTISFVIYDVDTLVKYSWEKVKSNYLILQRYDLSIYDLQKLNYRLHYPPTEAMRNMKMYPAYGRSR